MSSDGEGSTPAKTAVPRPGISILVVALLAIAVALLALALREERQQTACLKTFGGLWLAAPNTDTTNPRISREYAEVWGQCLEIDPDELMEQQVPK